MTYDLKFSKDAAEDLDCVFEYTSLNLNATVAAKKLMKDFQVAITSLKDQPFMCPVCQSDVLRDMGYRKLVVRNHVVIYFADEQAKTIFIVRIFYGRQNYDKYIK